MFTYFSCSLASIGSLMLDVVFGSIIAFGVSNFLMELETLLERLQTTLLHNDKKLEIMDARRDELKRICQEEEEKIRREEDLYAMQFNATKLLYTLTPW